MSGKFQGGIGAGSTSVSVPVVLRNTSNNVETTGVAFGSVTAYYQRQGAAPAATTALSALGSATAAWAAGGWFEEDSTHTPGLYRLDVDNAAFATGADWVIVSVKVSGSYVFFEKYALTTNSPQSGDSFPNVNTGAAPGASGGLVISTQLVTIAAVATGVWQDATAGDFTVAGSVGLSLFTGVTPGAHGGFFISGTNTGPVSASNGVTFTNSVGDGFICQSSGSNGNGVSFLGQGTGAGINAFGGGTSAPGIKAQGGLSNGYGLLCIGHGTGQDIGAFLVANNQGPAWASAIATGVWQDATAGDFTVSGSAGFTLLAQSKAPRNVATHQQFPMALVAGGAATGKTVTVQCSIDNAAYANVTGGTPASQATEVGNGDYYIALLAADRNGKKVMYQATAAGCVTTQWEMDADG